MVSPEYASKVVISRTFSVSPSCGDAFGADCSGCIR